MLWCCACSSSHYIHWEPRPHVFHPPATIPSALTHCITRAHSIRYLRLLKRHRRAWTWAPKGEEASAALQQCLGSSHAIRALLSRALCRKHRHSLRKL